MSSRLVVCFHHRGRAGEQDESAANASAIVRRALALGGRVIAWHATDVAIEFGLEAIDDAIELVTEDGDDGKRSAVPARFSVGIAEGPLEELVELGAHASLARGAALDRAGVLAHVARAGEILLDPALGSVRSERILTRGSRLGALGKNRVRGLRLDTQRPFRSDTSQNIALLGATPRIGAELRLPTEQGALGIVIAPRGAGASRALRELCPDAALEILPVLGEPLGALRIALERARPAEGVLDPEQAASIEALIAGEGLDAESSVLALTAWLAHSPEPTIVIDDAEHVDADSLEVLAALVAKRACALVACTTSELPTPLSRLPISASLQLGALPAALGAELVRALLSGRIDERSSAHWARRGAGLPLAIHEALAEGLESGEIVEAEGALAPRARVAGRSRRQNAAHWITRRLRFVDGAARSVLELLAVLGGSSDLRVLGAALEREHSFPAPAFDAALEELVRRRWITRSADLVVLPSATHVIAIDRALEDPRRARLHRAVALVLSESARPMQAISAAAHALLAGDLDGALPLARRGAAACQAAGLGATSRALTRFTESGDPTMFFERGLLGGVSTERVGLQRSDVPPAIVSAPSPALPEDEAEPLSEQEPREVVHTTLIGPMSAEPELAARLGAALKSEDPGAVDALLGELRQDESQALLADRVEAIACVARGQVGEALRLSRAVKRRAIELGSSERSRASLTHAIALAAAGRDSEALLEGLDGLARAREAADLQGERACARFLARLSTSVENSAAAEAWNALARADVLSL